MVYYAGILGLDGDNIEVTYVIKVLLLNDSLLTFSVEPVSNVSNKLKTADDYSKYYDSFISTIRQQLQRFAKG